MSDTTVAPPAEGIERRLATILCADVAGYSRLMGEDEERTVRVFRGHREIFESLVNQHRGRIFNTAGDALLAEFTSAVEAVRCATDIQSALRTRNEHLAPEERMQFRIGINLGDVIVQGGDLLGDGVNVAARIQAATEPGGICISGSVHDQIQDKLSLEFKALGEMSYKNIAKPVRTYTIAEGVVTAPPKRSQVRIAAAAALAAAIASAAWFAWTQVSAQREERTRLEAELAAHKKAAEDAQRAADDAKREAQLQAQKQAVDDTLRLAQAERARVEAEMKALDAQKKVAPVAAKPAAAAPAYDGLYSGELCNGADNKKRCWPVALTVTNGVVDGSWLSKSGKTSIAKGTVTDGAVRVSLEAWTPRGAPIEALLLGRISDGAISAAGSWKDGMRVIGEWRKGTFATAPMSAAASAKASASVARFDGRYAGKLCNHFADRPEHCWELPLFAKSGTLQARWKTAKGEGSSATGALQPDGTASLTLHSFNPRGEPVEATLNGRVGNGALELSGKWRGGMAVDGRWKREG